MAHNEEDRVASALASSCSRSQVPPDALAVLRNCFPGSKLIRQAVGAELRAGGQGGTGTYWTNFPKVT